jgi:hypothetical protein
MAAGFHAMEEDGKAVAVVMEVVKEDVARVTLLRALHRRWWAADYVGPTRSHQSLDDSTTCTFLFFWIKQEGLLPIGYLLIIKIVGTLWLQEKEKKIQQDQKGLDYGLKPWLQHRDLIFLHPMP